MISYQISYQFLSLHGGPQALGVIKPGRANELQLNLSLKQYFAFRYLSFFIYPVELSPNSFPGRLRVLVWAHQKLKVVHFYHIETFSHDLHAFLTFFRILDELGWYKSICVDVKIKWFCVVIFSVLFPLPPNILHNLIVLNWILKERVLRVEVLLIHSYNKVFAISFLVHWVIYQYLVESWT